MSVNPPPTYYFFNIGFNPNNFTAESGALTTDYLNTLYLSRKGLATSIATDTNFTGLIESDVGINIPYINSLSGTLDCNSNLRLLTTTATINNLTVTNKIFQRANINSLIYSNASWGRQNILLTATGATLSPILPGAVNEYNILPFASSLLGTLTIPANTMLRGDTFKLTITGTYLKPGATINLFYKFYMLNETTNTYFLISIIQDSTNSISTQTYKIEQILYLRTDPGVAGLAVSNVNVFSGTTNAQLNNTGVAFNTTNPQRFVVTVVWDGGVNPLNTFSTHTTNLQTM